MPFVYDETQVAWPDDGTEPAPPRPDEFIYIPAPEFGGTHGPVRFEVPSPDAAAQPTEPPAAPRPEQRAGILQRLFGGRPSAEARRRAHDERMERAKREHARRWERLLSVMVPALRQIGGRRVYCRYDGGHDEGFAWFDSLELQTGERLTPDDVAERANRIQLVTRLRSAGFELRDPFAAQNHDQPSDQRALKFFIDGWLCQEWAEMLLGGSFGTGEYSMYGAFRVDLETCTITDDPGADPVVQNISISR